jgi:hypothetical protein
MILNDVDRCGRSRELAYKHTYMHTYLHTYSTTTNVYPKQLVMSSHFQSSGENQNTNAICIDSMQGPPAFPSAQHALRSIPIQEIPKARTVLRPHDDKIQAKHHTRSPQIYHTNPRKPTISFYSASTFQSSHPTQKP